MHGREQVERRPGRVRSHMEVQLIDRLQVGDLQEQRSPVGQHMGRPDRQPGRVLAGPGAASESSDEPYARRSSGNSRPARNADSARSAKSRSSGREKVNKTPFS